MGVWVISYSWVSFYIYKIGFYKNELKVLDKNIVHMKWIHNFDANISDSVIVLFL
jgi:hypothetical protein